MNEQSFEQQPYRSSPPEYTQYPSPGDQSPESFYVPPPYEPPQTPYAPPPYMPPPPSYAPPYMPHPPVYAPPYYVQEEPGSMPALLGFIFSLVSIPAPILLIPALILSIIGLRSRSRHGLALAGLIVSIILLVFWALYIAGIIVFAIIAASTPMQ